MLALMTGGVGCPDENLLVRFTAGQLSGMDLGSLEQHLDGCASCRSLIAQLASGATAAPASDLRSLAQPARVGRYHVERLLGGGAMGVVYAGRDRDLNRQVAIKLLRTHQSPHPESRARLLREAQTMARLSHPNLVPIFELGSDGGADFLAMELVDGPTLDLWLREEKRDWKQIVRMFLDAGRGLEAAHREGVVHRDFKPGNVLIGPGSRARVTDFGLARPDAPTAATGADAAPVGLTRAGSLLGTPAYMSPEQLEGQVADVRSDQFSFCVALVEALTGHRPFAGKTVEQLRDTMRANKPVELKLEPARLRRALVKGLAREPDQRFATIGQLLGELERSLEPKKATRPMLAALGLVAAAALGVPTWLLLNAGSRPAVAEAPAGPGAASAAEADSNGMIRIPLGEQRVLSVKGIERVAVGDASIADVKTLDADRLQIHGNGPGKTTVMMWTKTKRVAYLVHVVGLAPPTPSPPAGAKLDLFVAQRDVLTIPNLQRIAVGDQAVAEVRTIGNNQVLVTGAGPGRTMVLAWTSDGRRSEYDVHVRAAPPAEAVSAGGVLELKVGEQHALAVPGVSRVTTGVPSIAEAKAIGEDQVVVTAVSAGTTTLVAWARDKRIETTVKVTGPAAPTSEGGPHRQVGPR